MKEVTIKQSTIEFALHETDMDIMHLIRSVDYFGHTSRVVLENFAEVKGELAVLLFLGLLSRDDFHNIHSCLHKFLFDVNLSDLDSDHE